MCLLSFLMFYFPHFIECICTYTRHFRIMETWRSICNKSRELRWAQGMTSRPSQHPKLTRRGGRLLFNPSFQSKHRTWLRLCVMKFPFSAGNALSGGFWMSEVPLHFRNRGAESAHLCPQVSPKWSDSDNLQAIDCGGIHNLSTPAEMEHAITTRSLSTCLKWRRKCSAEHGNAYAVMRMLQHCKVQERRHPEWKHPSRNLRRLYPKDAIWASS